MREAQAALRRKQAGSGQLTSYPPSLNHTTSMANSHDSLDLQGGGVPGVHSMVGHTGGGDIHIVHKGGLQQQQQHQHHQHPQHHHQHSVHAHAATVPTGPDAAVTVTGAAAAQKPYKAAQVNVRKMPDLNAPDLLGTDRSSDGGSDGGRGKKKGNVFSRVFG